MTRTMEAKEWEAARKAKTKEAMGARYKKLKLHEGYTYLPRFVRPSDVHLSGAGGRSYELEHGQVHVCPITLARRAGV